jgi:transcriptional regulator with XRE-family HTH domain
MSEPRITDPLRRAIERSGVTRYAIAKATGVSESVLSRFVRGTHGISLSTAERLAEELELQLVPQKTKRKS